MEGDAWTVFTNRPAAGAMRGYGIPQAMWASECHMDDVAKALGQDPVEYRRQVVMPKGYVDGFSKNENYYDTFRQVMDKGVEAIDYRRKREAYANQTGPVRRGVGMALFWYNTAVWPISLESSSCRMVLNQDGSVQVQTGETEIGQGCDTAYAQMAADVIGIPFEDVHVVSTQDTDVTPFGTGAFQQLHPAHGDIHLHLREGASKGVRIVLDLVCTLRREVLGMLQAVEHLRGAPCPLCPVQRGRGAIDGRSKTQTPGGRGGPGLSQVRMVHKSGKLVIEQIIVKRLPCLRIKEQLLRGRLRRIWM